MAPMFLGLDLGELQWWKFKSSYMWNNEYHLRRTKFIVYQAAMIFCVVSESLGTAALSHYLEQQDYIQARIHGGSEYNNDYIGIASFNIFVGIYVAFIFGGAFFFDLMFADRREDRGIKIAWKVCSLMASVFAIADVIALTVIVSSHSAYVTGVDGEALTQQLIDHTKHSPLVYRHNGRALASLIFLWFGWPCVVASTVIMWISIGHDEKYGPFSSHARPDTKDGYKDGSGKGADATRLERLGPSGTSLPAADTAYSEHDIDSRRPSSAQRAYSAV